MWTHKDCVQPSTKLIRFEISTVENNISSSRHGINLNVNVVVQVSNISVDVCTFSLHVFHFSIFRWYFDDFTNYQLHLSIFIEFFSSITFTHKSIVHLVKRKETVFFRGRNFELESTPFIAEHLILTETWNVSLIIVGNC